MSNGDSELGKEMPEDFGTAYQRESQTVDRAPEVCGMPDIVHIPFRHKPAIQKVQWGEYITRDRDRNQIYEYAHFRLEQNGREQDGGNSAGSPYGIISIVILVFDKVAYRRHDNSAHKENHIQDNRRVTK